MADSDSDSPQSGTAGAWLDKIDRAQQDYNEWSSACDKIRKKYRYDGRKSSNRRRFQMLWSNLETIGPNIYAMPPKPVIQSRFNDGDTTANATGMILERAVRFYLDQCDYQTKFLQVRGDYLAYGRGTARIRYEPVFVEGGDPKPLDDTDMNGPEESGRLSTEDADPQEVLDFENVQLDFVQREDFIHPKARIWEEVDWIAFRSFLTRDELTDRFPDIGKKIPLDSQSGTGKPTNDNGGGSVKDQATVYEIWDKTSRKVSWVAKGWPDVLEEGEPYLKLSGFYPCPRPAYATLTSDSLEPVPDYIYYQDQVEEIDDLTARIASLTDSLKLVGFYPAGPQGEGAPEIERAVKPGFENRMVAVKSWATFTEAGKGGTPIIWLPVEQVAKIISECVQLRKQLIDDVYQITGIADIMRGATNPNETAEAQNLKTQWGTSRLDGKKREMARFARDVIRLMGEVMAEHFQIKTLMAVSNISLPTNDEVQQQQMQAQMQAQMQWQQQAKLADLTGQQTPQPPQQPDMAQVGPTVEMVQAMLSDGVTRRFRLDIETDSTIAANAQQERQDRTQFIQASTQFIQVAGQIIQAQPAMGPLMGQLLMFGVRAFPVARELEETIEKTIQTMEAQLAQPKPPPPDPEQQKAQADIQIANTKAQNEMAIDQQKASADMQIKQVELAAKSHAAQADIHLKNQTNQMKMQHQQQNHAIKMQQAQQNAAAQAMQRQQPPTQ